MFLENFLYINQARNNIFTNPSVIVFIIKLDTRLESLVYIDLLKWRFQTWSLRENHFEMQLIIRFPNVCANKRK